MFDSMEEVIDALYDAEYRQRSDRILTHRSNPVCPVSNQLVTGTPEVEGNDFTNLDVVTPDNVAEYFPRYNRQ